MSGPRTTRTKTIVMLALLTGIQAFLLDCAYQSSVGNVKAPDTFHPPITGLPTITIEDEHAGVWMPIDNFFTKPPNMDPKLFTNKRAGFLFQSGQFYRYMLNGMIHYYDKADTVVFSNNASTIPLVRGTDWDWINIVGEYNAHPDPPITWDYAGLLFPSSVQNMICDVGDACVQLNNPLAAPTSCADTLDKQPRPCVRLRSIHSYFEPAGIITYWQGEHGYDLSVSRRFEDFPHNTYVFKLKDSIKVEIWMGGARKGTLETQIAALGKNLTITIKEPPGSPHEDTYDPPTGPQPK